MRKCLAICAGLFVAAVAGTAPVSAQYPEKPITMIMPFAAGGSTDAVGRLVAEEMSKHLGQRVIVENKPGAASMVAADHVRSAAPDGYTIFYATNSTLCIVPYTYRSAEFTHEDFAPVSNVVNYSLVIVARPDTPYDDMAGLIAYARENPRKVTFGTTGKGGSVHMLQQLIDRREGIETRDVPYPGAAPSLKDVLGGRLDVYADGTFTVADYYHQGKVKILGFAGSERSTALPEVPTFADQGFPELSLDFSHNIVAPKDTPKEIVARLNEAVRLTLEDPKVIERLKEAGYAPAYATPEGSEQEIEACAAFWKGLAEEFGIELD